MHQTPAGMASRLNLAHSLGGVALHPSIPAYHPALERDRDERLARLVTNRPECCAIPRSRWFAWALLAGTLYLIIGVGFAPLSVPSVFFWRLAAWMVSAVVYAAHIGYEHFRIRNSPRSTALHVAFGAAVGAFGLAAAAIVHSLATGTGKFACCASRY